MASLSVYLYPNKIFSNVKLENPQISRQPAIADSIFLPRSMRRYLLSRMDRNLTTRAVENAQNFYVFCGSLLNLRLLSFNFGVIGEEKEEKRRTGGRPRKGGEAAKGARGPIRAVSPHFHMY